MITQQKRVLFFSRGLGWGHATRDVMIAEAMRQLDENIDVVFATYGAGCEAMAGKGYAFIDLGLPDEGARGHRTVQMGRAIRDQNPNIIISDEELDCLPLAKLFDVPTILVTNWLPPESEDFLISLVSLADLVIFPDIQGYFGCPSMLQGRVHFVGPIVRLPQDLSTRRKRIRQDWGIAEGATLIVVTVGGEGNRRIIPEDVILFLSSVKACSLIRSSSKTMILISAALEELFRGYVSGVSESNIITISGTDDFLGLAGSSDVVITRGGHTTLWELALMCVPSVAIPYSDRVNPANKFYAICMQRRGFTKMLMEYELNAERLALKIEEALMSGVGMPKNELPRVEDGAMRAAQLALNLAARH